MAREATLSVSLTHQLKTYVQDKVQSGQFESASEVIRQCLRSMQEQELFEKNYWSDLNKKVKVARQAIGKGDVIDGPSFMSDRIATLKAPATPRKKPAKKKRS